MVYPGNTIRQDLFVSYTSGGSELRLVLLEDGGCGIIRDGQLVESCDGDSRSVDLIVKRFLQLSEQL